MIGSMLSRALALRPFVRNHPAMQQVRSDGSGNEEQEVVDPAAGNLVRASLRTAWTQLRDEGFNPPSDTPCEEVTFFASPIFPELQSAWVWVNAAEQWVLAGDLAQGLFKILAYKDGQQVKYWSSRDDASRPEVRFAKAFDIYTDEARIRNKQLWDEAVPLRGDHPFLRRSVGSHVSPMRGWRLEPLRFHPDVTCGAAALKPSPDLRAPAVLAKVTNRYGAPMALQVHFLDPVSLEHVVATGLTAPSESFPESLQHSSVKLASRSLLGGRDLYLATHLRDAVCSGVTLGRTRLLHNPRQLRDYWLGRGGDRIHVVLSMNSTDEVLEAVSWLRRVAEQTHQAVNTVHID